ncbi:hypothetical protein BJ742DRAFT_839590 [Cladochytrium replicatum]|nr:hypothetical protein BJ742DRAFT_839590 [Cladochytrium replicatum]
MSLRTFLQNELLNLSNEARRKNPEIKEAAEKLLYTLRSLSERSSSATPLQSVPGVNDPIAVELAKNEDVLRPFTLSCETKNPKLVAIAMACIQRLINHRAISPVAIPIVLRTMSDLIHSGTDIQLKILQTMLPLMTNYETLHGEVLSEILFLCFKLQDPKHPIVNNTASATLRQVVIQVFDKMAHELESTNSDETITDQASGRCSKDAFFLFQDLCAVTGGEQPKFLKISTFSKGFGLELIESILSNHHVLIKKDKNLISILKEKACPLIIKAFSDRNDFPITIRLMRVIQIMIKYFQSELVMECEIFLSMFVKLVESDHSSQWQKVTVMEVYKSFCADGQLIRNTYKSYDANDHSTKTLLDMIQCIGKIIVSERPISMHSPSILSSAGSPEQTHMGDGFHVLSASSSSMKVACLDQLDKGEPPQIPEMYILHIAVQSLILFVDGQSHHILPALQPDLTNSANSLSQSDIDLCRSMLDSVWHSILPSFSYLVTASVDDDIFANVVKSFQNFTTMLGLHRLNTQRDAFLSALCKVCSPAGSGHEGGKDLPSSSGYGGSSTSTPSRASMAITGALGGGGGSAVSLFGSSASGMVLTERNAAVIRALLSFAQTCTTVLEDKAWYLILDTLQAAEMLVTTGKMGKKENSAISLIREEGALGPTKTQTGRLSTAIGGLVPPAIAHGASTATLLENQFASTLTLIRKLYDSTKAMDDSSFSEFVRGLSRLARDTVSGVSQLNSVTVAAAAAAKDSMKVADEKSIAVARLHDVAILNMARIIGPHSSVSISGSTVDRYLVWDTVTGSLIEMAHSPTFSVSIRNQVLWTFSEILTVAIQTPSIANDHEVEMKILEPLKRLLLVGDASVVLGAPVTEGSLLLLAPSSTPTLAEKTNKGGWFVDVQRTGLDTLNKILQTSGQQLSSGWELVFDIVKSVVVSIVKFRKNSYGGPESVSTPDPGVSGAAGAVSKAAQIIRIALRCVELIITDFLSQIQAPVLRQCIETVGLFGSQNEDLNISLTSVNLLWSIADFVLKSSGQAVDGSESAEKIKTTNSIGSGSVDSLWMYIFGTLSQLCSDPRPEVRNSANQTLFRTIGINGKLLTLEAWDEFIWNILFPLLERVKVANERTEQAAKLQQQMMTPGSPAAAVVAAEASPQRKSSVSSAPPKVVVHHSRNTPAKQWDETKVITLAGFSKCLVDFLPTLIKLNDRFERAWSLFLEYVKEWCLSGSPEVSNAAIKALRMLVKTEKVESTSQKGAISSAAVSTSQEGESRAAAGSIVSTGIENSPSSSMVELWKLVWDVWEAIGMGVINNADEYTDGASPRRRSFDASAELSRSTLGDVDDAPFSSSVLRGGSGPLDILLPDRILHGSFTQETLNLYVGTFGDIYDVIKESFGVYELKRLLCIFSHVLTYHTTSPTTQGAGPNAARIARAAADFMMNDVENLTPLQQSVLDIVSGVARPSVLGASEGGETSSEFEERVGSLLVILSFMAKLAYIRTSYYRPAITSVPNGERGFTYVALSKKSMQTIKSFIESHRNMQTIYSAQVFELCIEALGVSMQARHDGPSGGARETLPLWKQGAQIWLEIAVTGLSALEQFVVALPQTVIDKIYLTLVETFERFMTTAVQVRGTTSSEDISTDEEFDLSFLQSVEKDIAPTLGKSHVSDAVIQKFVEVIRTATKLHCPRATNGNANLAPPSMGKQLSTIVSEETGAYTTPDSAEPVSKLRGDTKEESTSATSTEPVTSSMEDLAHAQQLGIAVDVVPVPKYRLAEACIDFLFHLCADNPADKSETSNRIAEIVAPVVLDRSSQVLRLYIAERPLFGKHPMPRVRNEEILSILTRLSTLDMRNDILSRSVCKDNTHPIRSHVLSGRAAHLFYLYPVICDSFGVVARHRTDDDRLVSSLQMCLRRIGLELGVET